MLDSWNPTVHVALLCRIFLSNKSPLDISLSWRNGLTFTNRVDTIRWLNFHLLLWNLSITDIIKADPFLRNSKTYCFLENKIMSSTWGMRGINPMFCCLRLVMFSCAYILAAFSCLSNFIVFQHLSLRVCCHEAIFSKKQLQRFFPAQVIFRKTSLVEAAVIFENKEKATTMCSFWAAIKIRKLSCVRWRQQQQLAKSLFRTDKRTLWKDYFHVVNIWWQFDHKRP